MAFLFDTNAISELLRKRPQPLEDADLQIAATAIYHDLEIVTGNLKHFERIPGARINPVLADARSALKSSL